MTSAERRPVRVLDRLVHRGQDAEEAAGEQELHVARRVCCAAHCFAGVDRVHDDVVRVAAEERDDRAVARVGRHEAVEVAGLTPVCVNW